VIENTGWQIRFAESVGTTEPPTAEELTALRDLEARTAAAQGQAGGEE
jgi:glutaconate CoA-transferase subunit B